MRRAPIVGILMCLVASFLVTSAPSLSAAHCAWSIVTAPNPGGRETVFSDIDGVGEDVWVVGGYAKFRQNARTLAEHLTPEGWQVVPTPNRNARNNSFMGVRFLGADDVWAVGFSEMRGGRSRNLVGHWNGVTWQLVPTPTSGRGNENLSAVDAAPASVVPNPLIGRQMWAVGTSSNQDGREPRGMVLHYDGTTWSLQTLPAIDRRHYLTSVVAFSDTDVWAAGYIAGDPTRPLVLHYDGTEWSRVAIPNPGAGNGGTALLSIAGETSSDLYVAGTGPGDSLVMHFDGTSWTVEPTPAREGDTLDALYAIDTQPSGEVSMVGATLGGSNFFETLMQHRNANGTWSTEPTPNPTFFNVLLSLVVIDGGPTWAAGFRATRDGPLRNLLLRCG